MSSPTTMDQAAKLRVREALLENARRELQALLDQAGSEEGSGLLDPDASLEPDDISRSDEAGDLRGLFLASVDRHRARVRQIEQLDVAVTDVVGPGAVVGLDGARYVVGVASDAFACDGVDYEGIAADAPVGAAIAGLRLGDVVTVAGHELRIDFLA